MAAGIVNALLSILPIIIGFIGVYVNKSTKLFGGFSICFYIIVIPNMGGLAFISHDIQFAVRDDNIELGVVYFCTLIIIYMLEIIISAVCMYKMKFTCCGKTIDEDDERTLEMEGIYTKFFCI